MFLYFSSPFLQEEGEKLANGSQRQGEGAADGRRQGADCQQMVPQQSAVEMQEGLKAGSVQPYQGKVNTLFSSSIQQENCCWGSLRYLLNHF